MEKCPKCKRQFEVEVAEEFLRLDYLYFDCPYCGERFGSEQIKKVVWKRDEYSGTYYTTLVSRHAKIDGFWLMRFEYFDYLKYEKSNA